MAGQCIKFFLVFCVLLFPFANADGADFQSIQLVGNFNGITCEPDDPVNNMESAGSHLWRKLKYIDEPGQPDTIFFKFTADNTYMPMHWGYDIEEDYGYSGWGIAVYQWSPPSIPAILEEPGYYFFHFNDTTCEYSMTRPDASIDGIVESDIDFGVPADLVLTLLDSENTPSGTICDFSDDSFCFTHLPEGVFSVFASAPGYRDTTVTDIHTVSGSSTSITVHLTPLIGINFSSAAASRVEGGIVLSWFTSSCSDQAGFNIFRGTTPDLYQMRMRNDFPVFSSSEYRYFDSCEEKEIDYYYFIVEAGSDNPASYGPIKASAITPSSTSSLGQNYPNPFNPATSIPFHIAGVNSGSRVRITFYDVSGKVVERYDLGIQPAGDHTFEWNPSLSSGRNIPSGVYYCRLEVGKEAFTRKMIMLR
ncbi:MAG: T9SS type A sorting domain-containing protein [Candidatus Krumholzibacteriota bacterium]|nr:T9SS type A sorting domain-containing protein [Candidatus Krumholzibacteriota bacterium]